MKKRVKTWDQLLDGGVLDEGCIFRVGCTTYFAGGMEKYCGKVFEFTNSYDDFYHLADGPGWVFRDWMFENETETVERLIKEYEQV